jgi:ribosome-binding protein aMBF1 (putative translation factor)
MKDDGRCPVGRDGHPCPTCEIEAVIGDPKRLQEVVRRQLETEMFGHRTLGERLRLMRWRQGIKSVDLARRIGMSQATVSRWESNERLPTDEGMARLAEVLNVSTDWLYRGTKP